VVTGANRGIGHEIVRQLASKGITVILASRDEKSVRAATEEFHNKGLNTVDSHALDIADPDSVTGFAKWLKSTYGGLDILVISFSYEIESSFHVVAILQFCNGETREMVKLVSRDSSV